MRVSTILGVLLAVVSPVMAWAGPNADMKVYLEVIGPAAGSLPRTVPASDPGEVRVTAPGSGVYDVAVIAADPSRTHGFAGSSFRFLHDQGAGSGVDLVSFKSLGDMEFRMEGWPDPQGWLIITWNTANGFCPRDRLIPLGILRIEVFGPDQLRLAGNPAAPGVGVATCLTDQGGNRTIADYLAEDHLGWIGFGGLPGFAPDLEDSPVSTRETTWSRIKSRHQD